MVLLVSSTVFSSKRVAHIASHQAQANLQNNIDVSTVCNLTLALAR